MPTKTKTKVYCGSGKTPKNKVLGDEDECINSGQIRKYGLIKIDEDKLKDMKEDNEIKKQLKKIDKLQKETDKLYDSLKTTKNMKGVWAKIKKKEADIKKIKKTI